ncbi:MAG: hypothetical protein HY865_25785 [Chloroflexi bacterium]|nr:hypothetical protein [Chloroflexota bacterium]
MKTKLSKDPSSVVAVESVIAIGLVAIGFAAGQGFWVTLATTTAGIGVNWASNIFEKKLQDWMASWIDKDGILNSDISWALERSLLSAIDSIEAEWKTTYQYHTLQHKDPENAKLSLIPLIIFRENISKIFTPFTNYVQFISRQNFTEYLNSSQNEFQSKWNTAIRNYFWGHDEELKNLFTSKFESHWYHSFVKILISGGEKESKVRRSMQYLWQASITESMNVIQEGIFTVDSKVSSLQDWAIKFEENILQEMQRDKPRGSEIFLPHDPPKAPRLNHTFFGHLPLRHKLLDRLESQNEQSSHFALWGLPGSGKTTLALWLANEEKIKRKFTDGILWASFGKKPSIMEITYKWLLSLGVDHKALIDDTEDTRISKLKNLLQTRKCLVIFDDIWSTDYVQKIVSAIGENCFFVLTARSYDVLSEIVNPDNIFKVVPLQDESAIELLIDIIGKNSYANYIQQDFEAKSSKLLKIIHYFGNLPLAIRLIGPSLRQRIRAGLALDEFIARMPKKFQEIYRSTQSAVEQNNDILKLNVSIDLSFEFLPDDETRQALLKMIPFGSQPIYFDWDALQSIWSDTSEKMEKWLIVLTDTCLINTVTVPKDESTLTSKGLRTLETTQLETRYSIHPTIYLFIQQKVTRSGINTKDFYRSYAQHYLDVYKRYSLQYQESNSGQLIDLCTLMFAEHGDWPHIKVAYKWSLENWQSDNRTAILCLEYAKLVGDRTLGCLFCWNGDPRSFIHSWISFVESSIPIAAKLEDNETKALLESKLKKLIAITKKR